MDSYNSAAVKFPTKAYPSDEIWNYIKQKLQRNYASLKITENSLAGIIFYYNEGDKKKTIFLTLVPIY